MRGCKSLSMKTLTFVVAQECDGRPPYKRSLMQLWEVVKLWKISSILVIDS